MLRLLACVLCAALFLGANFIAVDGKVQGGIGGINTPVTFEQIRGFPFEISRETVELNYQVDDLVTVVNYNSLGITINSLILLLFMANVLVLKFGKSETTASAPVSATPHAPH